ncbi:MAG: amidohydrolase family protein [Deltaproteobacteria bacterium]|nr:amidohydrolase family protein [Deltaproteobacteria bacterium]
MIIDFMDEKGIHKAVIFGFPWEKEDHFRRHNDYILESIQRYPERFVGFCCFSPLSPKGPREAERCLQSGLSGIGELALYDSDLPPAAFRDVMNVALRYDRPILIHTNEPVGHVYPGKAPITLSSLYTLLKAFPDNKVVLAHWGGGIFFYGIMKKEVREVFKNTWFDTAASPYLYSPDIYRLACEILGPERFLLGSDYPLLTPERYLKEMDEAGISEQCREQIAGLNAARLLGISSSR